MLARRSPVLLALIALLLSGCAAPALISPPQPTALAPTAAIPTPDSKAWQTRWLQGIPCRAPCWEGVTPGQTSASEALSILSQNPLFNGITQSEEGTEGSIKWIWGAGKAQGFLFYGTGTVSKTVDLIYPPFVDAQFRLGDILKAYGEPSHVEAFARYIGRPVTYSIRLYYKPQGFSVLETLRSGQKPQLDEDLVFEGATFFSPLSTSAIEEDAELIPWQGLRDFDFYCRDAEQHQSCQAFDQVNARELVVAAELGRQLPDAALALGVDLPLEVAGYYRAGGERRSFEPCTVPEKWWAEVRWPPAGPRYDQLTNLDGEPLFIRLRGTASASGKHGYLGLYNRTFTVSEVLELREPRAGDCLP